MTSHPQGSVKEQISGLHARYLAGATSFITLAFEAGHQGDSSGLPRFLEDLCQRAYGVRNAITYIITLDSVDPDCISVLGVCVSGGYVPFPALTDRRIKAIAIVSGIELRTLYSEGFWSIKGTMMPT